MKALIVDDAPVDRALMRRVFERLGYETQTADSGEQALELLAGEATPDVITIDLYMPGIDGMELVTRIRQDQQFRNVKILMCTTDDTPLSVRAALDRGAHEYLMKPLDPKALTQKLRLLGLGRQ